MEEVDDVSFDHKASIAASTLDPASCCSPLPCNCSTRIGGLWELCEQINRCQNGKPANGVLPPAVACLADQIRKTFQVRTDPKDWEQFQIRRTVNTLDRSVLLCGMGLIDLSSGDQRILIVLNESGLGAWQDQMIGQAKATVHLTARETTVVHHLLKGWTNKEIATEMGVAEQTVKEHCKHLLEKTSTTTRTGIVMQIVHCGLRHAPTSPSSPLVGPARTSRPIELVAV